MSQVNSCHLMQHIIVMLTLSDSRIVPNLLKGEGRIGRIDSKIINVMNKSMAYTATINSLSIGIKRQTSLQRYMNENFIITKFLGAWSGYARISCDDLLKDAKI